MSILIKVISAQLTRDTEFFSNMDPYCILRLGSQTQRTKTKSEAGKKPVWNQSFRFTIPDNNLKVVIMDEDNVSDDVVGEGQVDLSRYRGSMNEQEHIVQLYYQGKAAGKVMLRISGSGQQGNNFNQGTGNNWGNQQNNQNQWGGQPQNNQWGMPQQQNNQWGGQPQNNGGWGTQPQNNQWGGNQNSGWNQQPGQFGNQGGSQWGGQGVNPNNQQPNNFNQFNPIIQGIVQGSSQWGNPPNNQWGGNQPQQPNSQWGGNQQQPPPNPQQNAQWGANQQPQNPQQNNQWGGNPQSPPPNQNQNWGSNPQNPKPSNDIVYPDLEYKPPVNNNTQQNSNQGGNQNMDVPYQLIGGMQGLFSKPSNNQGGNPYQV